MPVLDVWHTSIDADGEPYELTRFVIRGDMTSLRYDVPVKLADRGVSAVEVSLPRPAPAAARWSQVVARSWSRAPGKRQDSPDRRGGQPGTSRTGPGEATSAAMFN